MTNIRRKVDLYIISLGLLFIFFIIIAIEFPAPNFFYKNVESWRDLVITNPLPLISIICLLYGLFAYARFDFDLKGSGEIPFEIKKLEIINYEHLTFLATYIVPLISFDFGNGRQIIVLALLLVVMGVIYIKTDLFYANPSLALLGFHIYRASGHFKNGEREGIVLICRRKLAESQKVSYIKLDERIYYVKEMK